MNRLGKMKRQGGRHTSMLAIILVQLASANFCMMNINTLLHLKNGLTSSGKMEKYGEKITTTYAPETLKENEKVMTDAEFKQYLTQKTQS